MKRSNFCPLFLMVLSFSVLAGACGNRKTVEYSQAKTVERVFVVDLLKDSTKIKEYLSYHAHIWPEVEAGFRKAGYQRISLYLFNDLVVMTVVVPLGANLDSMGKVAEASDKRCGEWNRVMSGYQKGVDGTKPGETWVEAKAFYSFSRE